MSYFIARQDATILTNHAKRGDAQELGRTLGHLALQAPRGIDRADILLLAKDEVGANVFHCASAFGNLNIITFVCGLNEFTLKPGVLRSIANARNNIGDTPVHSCAQNNQIACLTTLLDHGADLDAVGSFRFRVTHFAARDRWPDMLRYVLQRGADPNAVSLSHDTPAHFAARNRDMFCLRALHTAGGHLRGQNMAGDTPANIAERLSNEEMMVWMREQNIF